MPACSWVWRTTRVASTSACSEGGAASQCGTGYEPTTVVLMRCARAMAPPVPGPSVVKASAALQCVNESVKTTRLTTGEEEIMTRKSAVCAALAFVAALVSFGAAAQWKPTKPITIIVPWAAGGSTDQVTRVTAAELEKALGQKVIIVNQPGASGSIGTKNALEAPKDGYTWTAGAAQDLGTYAVLGMLDTKIGDWVLFLNVANVSTLAVNPNTPYKTPTELIDAMKAKP